MVLPQADVIFNAGNLLALVGWVFLLVAPRRWPAVFAIPQFLATGLLSLAYVALIATTFSSAGGDFGSIAGVRALFANDYVLTAGWFHYLAFDLFVGCWIAREADRIGVHRLLQVPFFGATFMFGPLGFLLFVLTRFFMSGLARGPRK